MKLIIQGFLIGIAKIMPGISGAVLSISFGLYERIIKIISNPFKINKEDIKFLFLLGIGALSGIFLLCKVVGVLLKTYYFPTMLLFIGLIIGSLKDVIKELKINFSSILTFFLSFTLLYTLTNSFNLTINSNIYFVIGIIEAFTTIIPGISGTAIFMSLGLYDKLLDLYTSLSSFNINGFTILFVIGFIIGAIVISKIINFTLKNYRLITYTIIFSCMIYSILNMSIDIFTTNYTLIELFISPLLFIIGLKISDKLSF